MTEKFIIETLVRCLGDAAMPQITKPIGKFLKSGMIYTSDISTLMDESFKRVLIDIFKNCPTVSRALAISNDDEEWLATVGDKVLIHDQNCFDYTFFRGYPIVLTIENSTVASDGTQYTTTYLHTVNTNRGRQILHEFTKSCLIRSYQYYIKASRYGYYTPGYQPNGHQGTSLLHRMEISDHEKIRTFDDIFVPSDIKTKITDALDGFISKKDWYRENKIPYHFGILLCGHPGTGKSTLAQAISKYTNSITYVFVGSQARYVPLYSHVQSGIKRMLNLYETIILEDIDIYDETASRTKDKNDNVTIHVSDLDKSSDMAALLNYMDGMVAPSNTIFVLTTNHSEKIDPAILRPGRIDLCINVGYVTNETFKMFCEKHYGEIPNNIDIIDGVTFADLQTDFMQDISLEELIEKYSKKKRKENKND